MYFLWLPSHRVLYGAIPRAGHGSIRQAIEQAIGPSAPKPRRLFRHQAVKHLPNARYSFAVIRHPWDRLVSAWAYVSGPDRVESLRGVPPMDFRMFLGWLEKQGLSHVNKHFRSQASLLMHNGRPIVDDLYHFEDFPDAYRRLRARLYDVGLLLPETLPHIHASAGTRPDADARLRRRVEQLYADDVKLHALMDG